MVCCGLFLLHSEDNILSSIHLPSLILTLFVFTSNHLKKHVYSSSPWIPQKLQQLYPHSR